MIGFLRDLVARPTYETEGELQVFLAAHLRDLGFQTWMEEVYPGRPNLYGRRGRGGPLLTAHVDTFPPYSHPAPFDLTVDGGHLVGRGALDVKGQIAALFRALSDGVRPCLVAFTVDEERQGRGSAVMSLEADAALVLEPTDLDVAVAQAGFIEATVDVPGRAAHAALPERGENAVLKALRLYEQLMELPFMRARHPLFPPPWSSLGRIHGGHEPNAVPEHCRLQIDLSVLPGVELEESVRQVRELVSEFRATLTITDLAPPFETDVDAVHVRTLRGAHQAVVGQPSALAGMRSWTDAEHLVRKGIPCVIYGAGDLAVAHSAREEVALRDLETLAAVLAEFIRRW